MTIFTPDLLPLLRELGDLKRIRSAGRDGSVATRLFEKGWAAWLRGEDAEAVALRCMAQALAAARLGDLDHAKLSELGLSQSECLGVLERAIAEVEYGLNISLVGRLKEELSRPLDATFDANSLPQAIALLHDQPRAGVTGPGRPRIMLQPEENHAEHSFIVALYAGLLAPFYDANPARAFWHGMIHHLHSAAMPDAGYTGEVLLGDKLDTVIDCARDIALSQLPEDAAQTCRDHLHAIADDATPSARAFHAADVIDRVIEIEQHLKRSAVTMDIVLGDYGLVHDGPVKPFHDTVLREIGLP